MYDIERGEQIIAILKEKNSISVRDLSEKLYVSQATIRRDLNKLEKNGLVIRTFGGVCLSRHQVNRETASFYRAEESMLQKKSICNLVAPFIHDNMCLFLDSSTTVFHIISILNRFESLTIITNGLSLATEIIKNTSHEVILVGGVIQPNTNSILGSIANNIINSFHADLTIMSSTAVSERFGFSESTIEQSSLKQAMIRNSDLAIVLITSSKFDKESLYRTTDIKNINVLITDKKPSQNYIDICERNNVKLIY